MFLIVKIVGNAKYITNIVNIASLYINLSYWPSYFKKLLLIIISKLNKPLYNTPKIFYSIILLNILGKLIEKVISSRLQIHSITTNFIYQNQIGGIKQQLIIDIGIYLTYLI